MKILYVEDNMANLYLVKRIAHGHQVINYIDGEEALTNFDSLKPDLVFMDIQLVGEMTGLDVVRALRARGDDTPIVAVTAYAMVGDREKCLEAGCTEYLAKPLPIPEVIAIINRHDPAKAPKPAAESVAQDDAEKPSTASSRPASMPGMTGSSAQPSQPIVSGDTTAQEKPANGAPKAGGLPKTDAAADAVIPQPEAPEAEQSDTAEAIATPSDDAGASSLI